MNILLDLQENPHKATRQVAVEQSVCKSSVLKYLHKNKWHPYKVHLVQELNEDDFDRRLEFCEIMMDRCSVDPQLLSKILFSDEATFCLNGSVNKQNCRYWAPENPHWSMECHTQFPQKVNVWVGIVGTSIVGPFFIEGTLNSVNYLDLLQNYIIPNLTALYPNGENPNIPADSIWFQQDGAPPHYSRIVRDYLNNIFPNRWIGRRGVIEWPARSPDLTPLDFYLWGYLKSKVYFNKPENIEQLKNRIRAEIQQIQPQTLNEVLREFQDRLAYCQEVNGQQFEHLIK